MPEFNVHSDSVNVEQVMEQIRARIREKRGVDYTEAQIRELAAVKLEKFLDPRGIRSDLLEQSRRVRAEQPPPPNYAFEEQTLFESHRAPLRWIRRLLRPVLKLFFNPNPLIQALHIQAQLNDMHASRRGLDQLHYEVLHNLVVETTRLGIEVKNLKMRVESLTSRLEFSERRARALESVVAYQPKEDGPDIGQRSAEEPPRANLPGGLMGDPQVAPGGDAQGPGQRNRRRRRRRGRHADGPPAAAGGAAGEFVRAAPPPRDREAPPRESEREERPDSPAETDPHEQ
jgi:hypothetical protein